MSATAEIAAAVGGAAVIGALGWGATPLFARPQHALSRALSGKPIAVEVQVLTDHMSDISALL